MVGELRHGLLACLAARQWAAASVETPGKQGGGGLPALCAQPSQGPGPASSGAPGARRFRAQGLPDCDPFWATSVARPLLHYQAPLPPSPCPPYFRPHPAPIKHLPASASQPAHAPVRRLHATQAAVVPTVLYVRAPAPSCLSSLSSKDPAGPTAFIYQLRLL